jgi:hypothetical protein
MKTLKKDGNMCFKIEGKKLTAKEDIVCYKIVRVKHFKKGTVVEHWEKIHCIIKTTGNYIFSIYRGFPYILNRTYETKFKYKVSLFGYREISSGFHSYISKEVAENKSSMPYNMVVKCIIPKGSKYYVNNSKQEFVSTKIKILEVIFAGKYFNYFVGSNNRMPYKSFNESLKAVLELPLVGKRRIKKVS